ncbi:cation channel sperm-associated auxiliary subunit delta-like [Tiliqua scincoides]|uniref:cation channel sperm-associated auxiliary subunit delta-like n=1 Tax=Tiliqua scincoides TaxID=71010 RepID=UPI003461ED94
MTMWKASTCLALLGKVLLCLVKVSGNDWACSEERLVFSAESLNSQKTVQGHSLSFIHPEPTLLQHPCANDAIGGISPALYLGNQIFLSLDGFESSLLPLSIPQNLIAAPALVSAAAFVHKTQLLLVINEKVFHYFYDSWKTWAEVEGITAPVNEISNTHCCYAPEELICNRTSTIVIAYDQDSWGNDANFFISINGGYSFNLFQISTDWDSTLLNIFHFAALSKIGVLYNMTENNKTTAYFQYIDTGYLSSQEGIPFVIPSHEREELRSMYIRDLRGFIIFWTKGNLQWSTNHGLTVETIVTYSTMEYSATELPVAEEGIRSVAATSSEIAILTKYRLFYGSLDMFSKQLVHIAMTGANSTVDHGEVIMFENTGMLCILYPVPSNESEFYNFRKCKINIQATLMTVLPPLPPCPVEVLSGEFHHKMYYMDMKKMLYFDVIFVPKPGTGSFPYVTVNNPYVLAFKAQIVQDGYTYDGNMKYRLEIILSQQNELESIDPLSLNRPGLSTITVDVYNKGLFCIDMHPLTALIAVDCPPTKNIKLLKNATACTKGLFNQYVLQTNFTYTIHADAYDPRFLGRKSVNHSNLNVSYMYEQLGCPLILYFDNPWLPTLELWEDNKFVEYVPADFVLFEINGMHTYDYLLTETEANCLSEAQNWSSLLNSSEGNPHYAWNRHNYESCKVARNNSAPSSSNKYQVLNLHEKNRVLFQQYNGIYIFKVIVVDPFYSYCELTTVFSVYVHGALPHSEINPGKTLISFLVLIFGSILIVYCFPKLLKENAKMKSVWT